MTIRKKSDGKWLLDFYPEGKPKGKASKRIRKTFSTKGEALAYQNHIMENIHVKPWLDGKEDRRTLRELVGQWFDEHGVTLDEAKSVKELWSLLVKEWGNRWRMSLMQPCFLCIGKSACPAKSSELLA